MVDRSSCFALDDFFGVTCDGAGDVFVAAEGTQVFEAQVGDEAYADADGRFGVVGEVDFDGVHLHPLAVACDFADDVIGDAAAGGDVDDFGLGEAGVFHDGAADEFVGVAQEEGAYLLVAFEGGLDLLGDGHESELLLDGEVFLFFFGFFAGGFVGGEVGERVDDIFDGFTFFFAPLELFRLHGEEVGEFFFFFGLLGGLLGSLFLLLEFLDEAFGDEGFEFVFGQAGFDFFTQGKFDDAGALCGGQLVVFEQVLDDGGVALLALLVLRDEVEEGALDTASEPCEGFIGSVGVQEDVVQAFLVGDELLGDEVEQRWGGGGVVDEDGDDPVGLFAEALGGELCDLGAGVMGEEEEDHDHLLWGERDFARSGHLLHGKRGVGFCVVLREWWQGL